MKLKTKLKKIKPKKEKDSERGRAETIKEIYLQQEGMKLPQKVLNWTGVVVVSLIIGLFAGWLGSWWQVSSQSDRFYSNQANDYKLSEILQLAAEQNNNIKESFDDITTRNLSNQTVLIYNNNYSKGDNDWSDLYTNKNLQGSGLVVTSDGWLVTTISVIDDANADYLIITNDRQGFVPTDFIYDDFNDLVFVKIDKKDLNPIVIQSAENIKFNDDLIVLRNTLKIYQPYIYHTKVINKYYTTINKGEDFLHSTDKNDNFLLIKDSLDDDCIGSPLANTSGEVVGIIADTSGEHGLVIGGFNLQVAIRNFLSNEMVVKHNSLGINYIDLAEIVGWNKDMHQGYSRGALVYGNNKILPVAVGSIAESIGLEMGDIILQIDDQKIESGSILNKLLQEYPLGSTVNLSVIKKSGETEEMIATLDTK